METFTDKQVTEILGLDFEADEGLEHEHRKAHTIQVCAGTWKRVDAETWYFEEDPEWSA